MTGQELLELAAKAAGYEIVGIAHKYIVQGIDEDDFLVANDRGGDSVWNPLTDDGDALRLAVKLRLTVSWDRYDDCDYATATAPHTHQGYDCIVDQNPYAATRRAIVQAAAEIGKAMKD